ncbi:MAG: DMT family transporter [Planctomycetaceae bacterium]
MLSSIWMLCGAVAFATMGACASAAGRKDVPWEVIALVRAIGPFVVVGAMCLGSRVRIVVLAPFPLWVRSICGSISLLATFYAFTRLPVGDVLTLTNLFPLWVAILSWPLLGHPPMRDVWPSLAMGLVGIALIQQPHLAEGNYASFAALVASLLSSLAMIGLHRVQNIGTRAIIFHFSIVSLAFCLTNLWISGHMDARLLDVPRSAWWPLLGVALSATAGQFFLTLAFTQGHPARVSIVGLSQAGFALMYDVILWGRVLDTTTISGMLLVLGPCAWMMWRAEEQSHIVVTPPEPDVAAVLVPADGVDEPPLGNINAEARRDNV